MIYSNVNKNAHSSFLERRSDSPKIKLRSASLPAKNDYQQVQDKKFVLSNNIHCSYSALYLKQDFHLNEVALPDGFFVLRIDEISHAASSVMMAGRKYNAGIDQKNLSVIFLNSPEKFTFFASENSHVNTLEILIPHGWFLEQLPMNCSYDLLMKYLALKTRKPIGNFYDHFFRNLFSKITREAAKRSLDFEYVQNKVQLLLATFMSGISPDLNDFLESEKVKISKDEINRLITLRKFLDTGAPQPTFDSLTKMALMSGTSLKSKFKKMYGTTIFEYIQSVRMQRARILLLTHKYSVKQIGQQLGYSNMSNFTIAFKKEFNRLPHELIK